MVVEPGGRKEVAAVTTQEALMEEDMSARGRVLVVDDERGPRQSLRMLLKETHEVLLAEDVASAMELLGHEPVDLIITDLRMPRQSGVDLLQWVKREQPDTEVIILTGYGQLESAMKAVEYGAFAYVEKPFDSMTMLKYVEDGLEKRRRTLERRQMEELALEANRFETLGRFVSGMLHDLGTPLSVVGSQLELAMLQPMPADLEQRVKIALGQVEHCSDIVRSTMGFLRHSSREHVPIDINDMVRACLDIARPFIVRQGVEVQMDLSKEVRAFRGDFTLVRQAVLNLVTNACQAMENQQSSRMLELTSWMNDGWICLSVGDTGPGIPPEARQRVFTTFYTTKGKGGTGLGLAVVQNVVQRHNGLVRLTEHPSGGALFTLHFPQAE